MKYGTINENHLFAKTYSKGKKVVCKNIIFYVLTDKHAYLLQKQNPLKQKINRVGITVSKKYGCAVERNRAKRIIREAWCQINKDYDVRKGNLVVICVREPMKRCKTENIYRDLEIAVSKSGLTA